MSESWANHYIGIPFREAHCWELVRRVYDRELGIELRDHEDEFDGPFDAVGIASVFDEERSSWREVFDAAPFDVLWMRCGRHPTHVAVVVDPPYFLHAQPPPRRLLGRSETAARIDSMTDPAWSPRIVTIYRHASR